MRKIIIGLLAVKISGIFITSDVCGQNIGIGTTVPAAKFRINHRASAIKLVDSASFGLFITITNTIESPVMIKLFDNRGV